MATATKQPKTPATRAAQAETAVYTVVSPLLYDNEHYAPGDEVELSEATAAPLLGHTVEPKKAET